MLKTHKKYALIGTSCVGKTTLLVRLHNELKKSNPTVRVAVVEEAARSYFSRIKVRKTNFLSLHQQRIQHIAHSLEKEAHQKDPDIILTDRSVLDAVVYTKAVGDIKGAYKLLKKAAGWLPTYTHLFLLDPTGIHYKTDDIRKENKNTREHFHQTFLDVLASLSYPYSIISGNKKTRVDKMISIIHNS